VSWPRGAGRRISLPTYAFLGERHWFDSPGGGGGKGARRVAPKQHAVAGVRETPFAYASDATLPRLFAERARADADRVAAVCGARSVTYGELDAMSARVAACLRDRGVGRETFVGIFFDRGVEMLAALLGAMRAGATYVPLDPTFPAERLAYIAEDTKLRYLLTNRDVAGHFAGFAGDVIPIGAALAHAPRSAAIGPEAAASDVAYVLYTSGSTGRPKGVQVLHRGLANFLCFMGPALGVTRDTHLAAVTTICFDIAGLELFLPLLAGGRVEIVEEEICKDGLSLRRALDAGAANAMQATPSAWRMLISSGWRGRPGFRVFCGGEALSRELAEELLARSPDVWNLYGPTETTIWSTMAKLAPGGDVTLGEPIGNTVVYVLDERGEPVDAGASGELCIGGAGVAKGYLHRPDLTTEKFVPDPRRPGETMYRTGDLVLCREDGALVYAGRLDNQVKLRGYRIELEEIEKVLEEGDGIAEAVAVVRDDRAGQKALHAFYLRPDGAGDVERSALSARLRERLPEYMVPTFFTRLASFPMTLNRKIDRKALVDAPLDDVARAHGAAAAPPRDAAAVRRDVTDPVRAALAKVLRVAPASIDPAATFADLGLDSVTLTALRADVLDALGVALTPAILFKHPSLRALSGYLATVATTPVAPMAEPVAPAITAGDARGTETPRASRAGADDGARGAIAIIGMAGRFPQSGDIDAFFEALLSGKDCISEIPEERWDHRDTFGDPKSEPNRSSSIWGGFVPDVDKFDARFFNVSAREAQLMDPRQRLLVETVWKTCEDAGYAPPALAGTKTGVFVGAINSDYWDVQRELGTDLEGYSLSGFANSVIPNRVSFLFDWRGPSEAVDTACSSSLTAIHRAVASLRSGECDAAVAGGVNVILSPHLYVALSQNGMLSPDGRCKTFDAGANGYVRGEGVGAILLKRLADARRDGDHVYAVIRGSAQNHGGRANSLTAPNPETQVELLAAAYADAGVATSAVSFVETHGTGTKLGDPIEVESLIRAFSSGDGAPSELRCGLGAVKSNIGHLEAAAGIAGVIKVALAMDARRLPGNLHLQKLNALIDLTGSPFYVVDRTREWAPLESGAPLRAGVTSLGFGGASAHVVLESAVPPRTSDERPERVVVPLSAKSDEALRATARALRDHVRKIQRGAFVRGGAVDLASIAYTLQVGRAAMARRAAFVVRDLEELARALDALLDGRPQASFGAADGRHAELAAAWSRGDDVDWSSLRSGGERRVPLPTYPFESQRHWVSPGTVARRTAPVPAAPRTLGPLVDRNESTLDRVAFGKTFRARATYLRDHVIDGATLVPAVVDLELARAAGELAQRGGVRALKNVVFRRPLVVTGEARDASIAFARRDGAVEFSIEGAGGEIFAQGRAEYGADVPHAAPLALDAIRARCASTASREEFYGTFGALGYAYGPTLMPIRRVWRGAGEALAEIQRPAGAEPGDFVLHPSMMEGLLQTVAALLFAPEVAERAAFLPFSIGELAIFGALPEACFAHVVVANGAPSLQSRFHLALADATGRVLVTIRDYTVRPAKKEDAKSDASHAPVLFRPALVAGAVAPGAFAWRRGDVVAVIARDRALSDELRAAWSRLEPAPRVAWMRPDEAPSLDGIAAVVVAPPAESFSPARADAQLEDGFTAVARWSRALLAARLERRVDLLFAYAADGDDRHPAHEAVKGFARSLRRESEKVVVTAVAAERDALAGAIVAELDAGARDPFVVVRRGERLVEVLEAIAEPEKDERPSEDRAGGTYLVTGGVGALGMLVARRLVEQRGARVILCGRSAPTAERRRDIDAWIAAGARVDVVRADVSIAREVDRLKDDVEARYGAIHGVVHAAGVLCDRLFVRTSDADVDAVLAPKVRGVMNLDRAFASAELEHFVVFSSAVSFLGNAGQASYAYANAFLDAFAARREQLRARGERSGLTHAIQWPYWADGGMRVGVETEELLRGLFGLEPLPSKVGLAAFDRVLDRGIAHALVVDRTSARNARFLAKREERVAPTAKEHVEPAAPKPIAPKRAEPRDDSERVRAIVGAVLRVSPAEIEPRKDLAEYGYDSITFTELATALNRAFGTELTPAVFFELDVPSVATIARHVQGASSAPGPRSDEHPAGACEPEPPARAEPPVPTAREPIASPPVARAPSPVDDAVAIIGVSGRMPGAATLADFWRAVESGGTAFRVVPRDRWSWEDYYGGPEKKPGKSVSKWGAFVDDADRFDAAFFGMTAEEARVCDPQQRLFLEAVWGAIEDAGYDPESLGGSSTSLHVGVTNRDYADVVAAAADGVRAASTFGNEPTFLANRASYFLNLHGASEPVNTLCSSALVAIHKAAEGLRRGDADLAIAGGVSVIASPRMDIAFSDAGMLSAAGACRSFDKDGDGFVRGEGVGVLLLKRLRDAERDGDHVHAVIRASGVNHGGRANSPTSPNGKAQTELVKDVYTRAGVDPRSIQVLEAHGTGTPLGDAVELNSMKRAFRDVADAIGGGSAGASTCAVTCVKTNVGHLEAAAGVASVLKVILALRHETIPPLAGLVAPNAYVDLRGSPFHLASRAAPWPAPVAGDRRAPRRAAVSSFGASGVNAHLVIEEHVAPPRARPSAAVAQVIPLSARDASALRRQASALRAFAQRAAAGDPAPPFADVAFTLQTGRASMQHRLAVVAADFGELERALGAFADGAGAPRTFAGVAIEGTEAGDVAGRGEHDAVAAAWVRGAPADWSALRVAGPAPSRTPLPTYPFERARHWAEPAPTEFDEHHHRQILERLRDGGGVNGAAAGASVEEMAT